MRLVGLVGVMLVPAFWLAYHRSQRFDFLAHDQFVAGSSRIMALNARLDTVVLQQYRDPKALIAEQLVLLNELEALIEELALPRYLPPGAAADLEPMWQRLQTLVGQKRWLVRDWTNHNYLYSQALELAALEPLTPLLPATDGRLAAANRERELSLEAILASDLANLSQDLLDRYVVHCQAVLARDREWAVGLFIAFMLTASSLSLYAIHRIRRADSASQAADARYRNLFLNAVEGIFQTSPEGQFLDVNPALATILKFDSPQELIKTYDNLENQLYVEPGRRELLRSLLAQNSVVNHFESQVFCKDGAIIWISESVRAVFDSQGQLLQYEGTLADITARKQAEETLQVERERTDQLLLNILPQSIVSKLKAHLAIIAESYTEATILFADIVDFTGLASQIDPAELVKLLNEIFTMFDAIADSLDLEKIKTIGDAYMVVGGVPEPRTDHALAVVEMALAMQAQIARIQRPDGQPFALRIGINTGPVVAGVIGTKKFIYDLWGDAVNVASRMESLGVAGEIQVTETTAQHIHTDFKLEARGVLDVKGKGQMPTYWVGERYTPRKHSASSNNLVPLLDAPVDYCGVQRPGFPIAIGLYHNQKPYYRLESLPLGQALALQYAQLKLTRREYPEDTYLLLAYEGGYHLYRHHSALKHFRYAAALASICGQMRNHINCSDHFWRLRMFHRCFEGTVAVDWLCNYLNCDRDEAVRVGHDCLEAKLIHHVLDEQPFADAGYFYRFWQDGKPEKRLLGRLNTPLS